MGLLYDIFIVLYAFAARLLSLESSKARLWVKGRKSILKKLRENINPRDEIIWFHCASLGEFEQGRPLIERIRERQPQYKILLTFYSPSGYEVRKNYQFADYIYYLPSDSHRQARQFFDIVNPKMIFFIKYEFWYNYINEAHKRNIPFYSVSSIFRKNQLFFKWYGKWSLKLLKTIKHFFVQNEESKQLLNAHGIDQVSITGDTRFDRVSDIVNKIQPISLINHFRDEKFMFVCGSTWAPDEILIARLIHHYDFKMILAPHEVDEAHIEEIEHLLIGKKTIRYTNIQGVADLQDVQVIIVNTIGLLSSLYQYGNLCYIGGGFGKGIHNILEAATFGKPIIFGPHYKKFQEAIDLINCGAAFSINIYDKLKDIFESLYNNKDLIDQCGEKARQYVVSHTQATEKIYRFIFQE